MSYALAEFSRSDPGQRVGRYNVPCAVAVALAAGGRAVRRVTDDDDGAREGRLAFWGM
jgi:hypothetical protein